jgi:hypothetical protein
MTEGQNVPRKAGVFHQNPYLHLLQFDLLSWKNTDYESCQRLYDRTRIFRKTEKAQLIEDSHKKFRRICNTAVK